MDIDSVPSNGLHHDTKMTDADEKVDEGLYSRQLYVMGHEAQRKLQSSNVLLIGLKGLGVEIAKNIILAGVKAVGLLDNNPVELRDLSSQFFLSEADVGKPRAAACVKQLASLNPYVNVSVVNEPALVAVKNYKVVVATELHLKDQLALNNLCREHDIRFIVADIRGVTGMCFTDVVNNFVISDPNGEQPIRGMISHISNGNPGIVTVADERRHGLETGNYVTFDEVQGMVELNNSPPRPIKVISPFSFSIEDTSTFKPYTGEGHFQQVVMPTSINSDSLEKVLSNPDKYIAPDEYMHGVSLHFLYQALAVFQEKHGHLPNPTALDQAAEVAATAKQLAQATNSEIDEKFVARVARCSSASLSPLAALMGGIAGQEVMKLCSGKFTPLNQLLYFDSVESLPNEDVDSKEFAPAQSRYDDQIAVFGRTVQHLVANANYFLVGAGAIGCEMLKNWALMGVATGDKGQIIVTDMDQIEKSNLNRQFLFRSNDVGKLKSTTAAAAVGHMNPAVRIVAHAERVGAASEHVYDDKFWASLDAVVTALDNVDARLYLDQRCIYFQKPMVDSGTLGTKGNTQVIVPFLTESYGSSRDPPEESIPICTLKNFPHKIEHTIQWARDFFEGVFRQGPEDVNKYLSQSTFLQELAKQPNQELETLKGIMSNLVSERPLTFDECIAWARNHFEIEFNHKIQQLLVTFPEDSVTAQGTKFWSGAKRAPQPLQFDAEDPAHMNFVIAAANLRAFNYGLKGETDPAYFAKVLKKVHVMPFEPKKIKIAADDAEAKKMAEEAAADAEHDAKVQAVLAQLPKPATLAGYKLQPVEFEKDDDSNFHMAFVTATSNLRARNYRIKEVNLHQTKFIAGKIIPAIATTTAAVTGLVCLELLKLLQKKPLEAYRNFFLTLALPLISRSEPQPPVYQKAHLSDRGEWKWSLWDRLDVDIGDATLQDFLTHIQQKYGLEVSMLSYGASMLYFDLGGAAKKSRLKLPMSKLILEVAKVAVPPSSPYIALEACVTNADGEEVEIPYIRMKLA